MQQWNDSIPWWTKMLIYWLDNQVAITFYSELPPTTSKQQIIASLHLENLNTFLAMMGYELTSFGEQDVRHTVNSIPNQTSQPQNTASDINSLPGKHVFQHPSGQGSLVKCFFNVKKTDAYMMAGIPAVQMSAPNALLAYGNNDYSNSVVNSIVNLLNSNREALRQHAQVSILAASPNWLNGGAPTGGSGCTTHGGAYSPPFPVTDPATNWHITLPDLSQDMQKRTGRGVTIFVLDTSPTPDQITAAAKRAGASNALLQAIVSQLSSQQPSLVIRNPELVLPDILDTDNPRRPISGKDIVGRIIGYDVTDHGLFITGIIHDVAPDAQVECIRVLNNYGVGSVSILIEVLEEIHNRMLPLNPENGQPGDLYQKPVVINLSQIVIPRQEELAQWWAQTSYAGQFSPTDETDPLTNGLHAIIQSLTSLGAIIVAAAGNDSDARQSYPEIRPQSLIVSTQRLKPRYPAAYPEVLSVGAVDRDGCAAMYSNDPVGSGSMQHNGVATYGGDAYFPIFPNGTTNANPYPTPGGAVFDPKTMTSVDISKIDAIVGIYSSQIYPALSNDDQPQEYKAPNDHCWAYWSGTSFATPIVSAVAARLLEELTTNPKTQGLEPDQWHNEVMRAFTRASGQKLLTGDNALPLQEDFSRDAGINIGLLRAQQTRVSEQ